MKMTADAIQAVEFNTEMILDHIKSCRKNHRKMSYNKLKFWVASMYDWLVQEERLSSGKGPGRVGVDYIDFH